MDDPALMAAIAARDPAALSALYDRHGGTMFGLCTRILRDRSEAEETLGDVFLEVWNRADRYDPSRATPIAYLLNLTRSRALDRLRAMRRQKRAVVDMDPADAIASGEAKAAAGDSPFETAVSSETRARVLRALGELPRSQREAVELAYFSGLSHSEIAESLGEPLGTVKTRIRQGLIHLRGSLRLLYGGEVAS
jgi:RNA polymerase sigma-70 factor (ECF subfamily)